MTYLFCMAKKILNNSFLFDIFQGYIDAQEDGFQKFDQSGDELINANHYASDEIKDKVKLTFKLSPAQFTQGWVVQKLVNFNYRLNENLSNDVFFKEGE